MNGLPLGPVVYRVYDEDDTLLYVGWTFTPREIFEEKPAWWPEDEARVEFEEHSSGDSALCAKEIAVCLENPVHNRDTPYHHEGWETCTGRLHNRDGSPNFRRSSPGDMLVQLLDERREEEAASEFFWLWGRSPRAGSAIHRPEVADVFERAFRELPREALMEWQPEYPMTVYRFAELEYADGWSWTPDLTAAVQQVAVANGLPPDTETALAILRTYDSILFKREVHEHEVLATTYVWNVVRAEQTAMREVILRPTGSEPQRGTAAELGAEGWVICSQGHWHWGEAGAAGLLLRHTTKKGNVRFLLHRRGDGTHRAGTYGYPGGAIMAGETAEEAARRETAEETGLTNLPRVTGSHVLDHGNWAYTTFTIDVPSRRLDMTETPEADEYRWVTAEEALTLPLVDGAEDAIRYVTKKPRPRAALDRTLVLDFDGTISVGDGPVKLFADEVARRLPPHQGEMLRADVASFLVGDLRVPAAEDGWRAVLELTPPHDGFQTTMRDAQLAVLARLRAGEGQTHLPVGLLDLLDDVRSAGTRIVVVTNNADETGVTDWLERTGAATCFDEVVTDAGKPRNMPNHLHRLLARADPRTLASVGDVWTQDVKPAISLRAHGFHIDRWNLRPGPSTASATRIEDLYPALRAWADGAEPAF